ncbi:hypothetical protein AB0G79_32470 [Streptomyces sp. NPDC020807]|uniref:hypothetical protein n=1 Tax=Streptomyces sp. NPDC020807 TaxID=3155119 RepID=UPI0033D60E6B
MSHLAQAPDPWVAHAGGQVGLPAEECGHDRALLAATGVLGLATVVASHELAEVLVTGNGIRAGRRKRLPSHPALRTARKPATPVRPGAPTTAAVPADTIAITQAPRIAITPAPKTLLPPTTAPTQGAGTRTGGGCCDGCRD